MQDYVIGFAQLRMEDVGQVGGKNASLGEMVSQLANLGVSVPNGFATTAKAFTDFLEISGLKQKISDRLVGLNVDDVDTLVKVGAEIRQMMIDTPLQADLEHAITVAYQAMAAESGGEISVAVRSSATAEDLPDASFAGQQETFLNVRGLENVLLAVKHVFASLYNDRAIAYRVHKGFTHSEVALSAGIQRMVRSDVGASGVMFTLDTESGFRDVVFITSSYGLGEMVVQGAVNPDEFYVHKATLQANRPAILRRNRGSKLLKMIYNDDSSYSKATKTVDVAEAERCTFSISDADVEELARQALIIEQHYGRPMDIEWGKDGNDGKIYILQARPETVKSRQAQTNILERFQLKQKGEVICSGRSIGQKIGAGKARIIKDLKQMSQVQVGDVLVTDMTDPDWEPVMKRASAIVTNRGGRTCHAAIIARELGIPAVVGCGDATKTIQDGAPVTVSCAEGDTGFIYDGILEYEVTQSNAAEMPKLPFKIMMNVGNPDQAFNFAGIPNAGVGLARLEFIINRMIGIHPKALLNFDKQTPELQAQIKEMIGGYESPVRYYIDRLAEGVATIAAAFADKPVIVRLSDFKSNEYANLIGGAQYEPHEENPMIGFRGASRYIAASFRDCFELECQAMRKVRNEMGLKNVQLMIPFVRTLSGAQKVIEILAQNGLERGKDDLKVIMMCELPSNAILADEFLEYFDGFSIGSNDMTQLTLGLDRDSGLIAHLFDERDAAVKKMLHLAIQACRKANKYIGICGQGPSDHPDLARWLMDEGIESVSLNPDTVISTWLYLADQN